MIRTCLLAAGLALSGVAAQAAGVVGYQFDIFGNDTNVPNMTLLNTSATETITSLSMTIGATNFNFDAVYFLAPSPGGTISVTQGDGNASGGTRVDQFIVGFTSLDPTETAGWRVDVDIDNRNTVENFRTVFFHNGASPNSVVSVTFSDGTILSQTLADQGLASDDRFTFSQSLNPAAVPLPAGLPLAATGLAALGLIRRRRRG